MSLAHWQALLGFFLVAALFTASIGGVTAGEGQPQAVAPTPTAKTRKPTKTPSTTKTRKAKKTRTATPTDVLTETPAPSETLDATPTATETPTAARTRVIPAPKHTRKAKPSWNDLAKTRYEYDVVGRQTKLTKPGSQPLTTVYDHWLTTVTNEQGIPTVYRNDAFGRTNRVTESESGVAYHTAYSYDVSDRLSGVTDSAGNVTTMTYDLLGRKTAMTDPDMGTWSYRYDKNDNLIEQTDANLQRACFY